ncbi:MAG: tRNA (adenosine(37)-N6)-dimethylallyltransferase MiaA [Bacteroidales bacterium]
MMITILGPTAAGKTSLATNLALLIDAEIISADSRQVYKGMDIGTGKDLSDYEINGKRIPYHLIDICEAGEEYNVYQFMQDFSAACEKIKNSNKQVILCGGTGMYLESVLKGYNLVEVPENTELRKSLEQKPMQELTELILSMGPVHATSDLKSKERIITAIEKRFFYKKNQIPEKKEGVPSIVFGIKFPREDQRNNISLRLHQRLEAGMVNEVKMLIDNGIKVEQLIAYGLEYKWLAYYLTGRCSYNDMVGSLNVAIHRFAKRQETWFRRMEKNGIKIHWIDGGKPLDDKLNILMDTLNKYID